jgi:AraC family transcriptional regulator of adaptative response/methylated-DNA-[protein]-cysteine methyltransferase
MPRPDSSRTDQGVRRALERIAAQPEAPAPLEQLAREAGLSPFHLQRRFKAAVGVSPREYQQSLRVAALKQGLKQLDSVAGAIYGAGFGSASRVYEAASATIGMTPREYRRGGAGVAISYATGATPLGRLLIAATDRGICAIELGRSDAELERALAREFPAAARARMARAQRPQFRAWLGALNEWLAGRAPLPELPLELRGTAFQCVVWRYLQGIPRGETRSYAEVARGVGRPGAARAVARACATNRIALAIPCHRVIRGSGELGGHRWGIGRKQALLAREQVAGAR